jgi:Fur family ferric uptake transcriptional regulator
LIHLQCDELEAIRRHVLHTHHFSINILKTVFYGVCTNCRERPV